MEDTYPFEGHCARCEDTGATHTTRTSPVTALPTDYAVPCKCTAHGAPMLAMLNKRMVNREGTDILTSNGVNQIAEDAPKR